MFSAGWGISILNICNTQYQNFISDGHSHRTKLEIIHSKCYFGYLPDIERTQKYIKMVWPLNKTEKRKTNNLVLTFNLGIFPKKTIYTRQHHTIPQHLISQEHMTHFGILSIPSFSGIDADMPHGIKLTCQIPI